MKIVVTGTRGIPDIQGGVETHCEELFPLLALLGHDITVVRRSCYVTPDNKEARYKNVELKDVYAPRKKSLEAIVHTFLAVIYAKYAKADVVHIHAVGPSIMVPLARCLGLKVVMTHHGPDYDRQKWGALARYVLKLGEKWGVKYAHEVIVISEVIRQMIAEKYNRTDAHLIFNGVNIPVKAETTDYICSLGLEPRKYVVALGRFVEEKGFDLLIEAFSDLHQTGYKLVIAGDADHETGYAVRLKQMAQEKGVVLTGFIKGKNLNELLSHSRLFVLPSSHEGLPIALLEAMSYNLDILVSDIPANRLSELNANDFFVCGSQKNLTEKIALKLSGADTERSYDLSAYQWKYIAEQTNSVYQKIEK